MREFKILIRLVLTQFPNVFDLSFAKLGKNKKNISSAFKFIIPVAFLLLCLFSFFYSYGIGFGLQMAGRVNILMELAALTASVAIFFTSIYKIRGILFDFKDFDFVMSLPFKFITVVISRLLLLYLINLPTVLIIMWPAGVAYCMLTGWDSISFFMNVVGALLIPFIPITCAAAVGTIIAFIAQGFRKSKVINIILMFTALIGFMAASFSMNSAGNRSALTAAVGNISSIYPPAVFFEKGIWEKNLVYLLLFIFVSVGSLLLFLLVFTKYFLRLNSLLLKKAPSRGYKTGKIKGGTPFQALFIKELKRYFASVNYVLNTGFGPVLLTVMCIVQLFLKPAQLDGLLGMEGSIDYLKHFIPQFIGFCIAMTCISASSLSLEGKNLWLIKSLPVTAKTIFRSKIALNLVMTIPFCIIDGILLAIGLKLDLSEVLSLLILPIAISFYTSVSGLYFNLLLPKLDWSTEIAVIKQSIAVMVTMFTGGGLVILPVVTAFFLPGITSLAAIGISSVMIFIITGIIYASLLKTGQKKLMLLGSN
jgi:ABC-2 type transport system permease protein